MTHLCMIDIVSVLFLFLFVAEGAVLTIEFLPSVARQTVRWEQFI
jgi:hypothetical protein